MNFSCCGRKRKKQQEHNGEVEGSAEKQNDRRLTYEETPKSLDLQGARSSQDEEPGNGKRRVVIDEDTPQEQDFVSPILPTGRELQQGSPQNGFRPPSTRNTWESAMSSVFNEDIRSDPHSRFSSSSSDFNEAGKKFDPSESSTHHADRILRALGFPRTFSDGNANDSYVDTSHVDETLTPHANVNHEPGRAAIEDEPVNEFSYHVDAEIRGTPTCEVDLTNTLIVVEHGESTLRDTVSPCAVVEAGHPTTVKETEYLVSLAEVNKRVQSEAHEEATASPASLVSISPPAPRIPGPPEQTEQIGQDSNKEAIANHISPLDSNVLSPPIPIVGFSPVGHFTPFVADSGDRGGVLDRLLLGDEDEDEKFERKRSYSAPVSTTASLPDPSPTQSSVTVVKSQVPEAPPRPDGEDDEHENERDIPQDDEARNNFSVATTVETWLSLKSIPPYDENRTGNHLMGGTPMKRYSRNEQRFITVEKSWSPEANVEIGDNEDIQFSPAYERPISQKPEVPKGFAPSLTAKRCWEDSIHIVQSKSTKSALAKELARRDLHRRMTMMPNEQGIKFRSLSHPRKTATVEKIWNSANTATSGTQKPGEPSIEFCGPRISAMHSPKLYLSKDAVGGPASPKSHHRVPTGVNSNKMLSPRNNNASPLYSPRRLISRGDGQVGSPLYRKKWDFVLPTDSRIDSFSPLLNTQMDFIEIDPLKSWHRVSPLEENPSNIELSVLGRVVMDCMGDVGVISIVQC